MKRVVRPLCLFILCVVALAGCGDTTAILRGGRVAGQTLTVFSVLPQSGPHAKAAADIVLGEKLALAQANGMVGDLVVNYVALDEPVGSGGEADPEQVASTVREAIHDQSVIAVIGDMDARTARVSAPLLNAAGILHVSPGSGTMAFPMPSDRRTFAPLVPTDTAQAAAIARLAHGKVAVEAEGTEAAQALADAVRAKLPSAVDTAQADTVVYAGSDPVNARGAVEGILSENRHARVLLGQELATTDLPQQLRDPRVRFLTAVPARAPAGFDAAFRRTYPGRAPGSLAQVGWTAMHRVIEALRRAGPDAQSRQAVIDAYYATDPLGRAAARPFRLIS